MRERRGVAIDFPGLRVGVAENEAGPTGCTVFALDRLALLAVDARGGAPALINAQLKGIEALCWAGGGVLGVEATTGVAAELYQSRGSNPLHFPVVSGGALYDFAPPGRTGVYPDLALGRAALRAAAGGEVPVGQVGAGRSATCGKLGRNGWAEPGGQGAAFGMIGAARIVVVVAVNSLGVIVNRDGRVVRGNRNPDTGRRSYMAPDDMTYGHQRQIEKFGSPGPTATTLSLVLTDARIRDRELGQLARQIHASMARAIHPFHCTLDGDTLWLATTNETDAGATPTAIATVASELAWDAVLNAVDDDEREADGARLLG